MEGTETYAIVVDEESRQRSLLVVDIAYSQTPKGKLGKIVSSDLHCSALARRNIEALGVPVYKSLLDFYREFMKKEAKEYTNSGELVKDVGSVLKHLDLDDVVNHLDRTNKPVRNKH
ncbi:hypothetical protein JXB27_04055 [Candidatus Woesearchaeota archaeon]|nr:hypothetical protein [Candidatus Woesearchaeota archaeon]